MRGLTEKKKKFDKDRLNILEMTTTQQSRIF